MGIRKNFFSQRVMMEWHRMHREWWIHFPGGDQEPRRCSTEGCGYGHGGGGLGLDLVIFVVFSNLMIL